MKSAAILAAILASIPTNRDESRANAAASIAKLIRIRVKEASNAFPSALANPAIAVKVHPVDAVGADIAELLEKELNADATSSAVGVNIFFSGVARSGRHLSGLAAAEQARTGVPSTYFTMFSSSAEARGKAFVLVPDVDPGEKGGIEQHAKIIAGLTEQATKSRAEMLASAPEPLRRILEGLGKAMEAGKDEQASGCDGCITGLFTSARGKSAYMKFCPGNPIGEVLSSAARLVDAEGCDAISVAPVASANIPEGATVHPMES